MVHQMNFDKFNTNHHAWSDDHFSICNNDSADLEWIHIVQNNDEIPEITSEVVLKFFHGIDYDHPGFRYASSEPPEVPCVIVDSHPTDNTFDVVLFQAGLTSQLEALPKARILQVRRRLPEAALTFISRPFRSDMHWSGAFRHPIKIPDAVFPAHWKDLE